MAKSVNQNSGNFMIYANESNLKNFNFGFLQTLVRKIKYIISIRESSAGRLLKTAKVITNLKNFNFGFVQMLVRKIKSIISIRGGSASRLVRMPK